MKKIRKRIISVILVTIVILSVITSAGCGAKSEQNGSTASSKNVETSDNAEKAEFTGSVEDNDTDPTKITMLSKSDLSNTKRFSAVSGVLNNDGNESTASESVTYSEELGEQEKKQYTIMVYMVGSTLEYDDEIGKIGAATDDLNEMIQSGVDYSKVNVIVYTGGAAAWRADIPAQQNCVLDLSKCSGIQDISSAIVTRTEGSPNMGDPDTFASFINLCTQDYPAEKYGLICWDHGGGPVAGFGEDVRNDGDGLSLVEMKEGMKKTSFNSDNKLAFIGFDACLMASLENAKIWKDYANFLVASEESELSIGWDYASLAEFGKDQSIEEQLNFVINLTGDSTEKWCESRNKSSDITLSVMDLSKTEQVLDSYNELLSDIRKDISSEGTRHIQTVRYKTKEFGISKSLNTPNFDLIDVSDFAEELSDEYSSDAQNVEKSVSDMIVSQYTNLSRTNGVSIYYPQDQLSYYEKDISDIYKQVSVSKKYTEFLDQYVKAVGNGGNSEEDDNEEQETENSETFSDLNEGAQTEDTVDFQLTKDQRRSFISGYYDLFMNGYYPIMIRCAVEPDANGVIHVPKNPKILSLKTDESEESVPWMVREIEKDDDRTVYETLNTYLTAGPQFTDILDETLSVKARVVVDTTGNIALQSFCNDSEDSNQSGKDDLNLAGWEGLAQISAHYIPKKNSSGATLPISEWKEKGFFEDELSMDGNFEFTLINAADCPEQVSCQVVIQTSNGDTGTSGLVKLDEKNEVSQYKCQTDNGTITFDIFNDHAEASDYEGEDKSIEIPSEVEDVPVTKIKHNCFSNASKLAEIAIPEGVESIGNDAFSYCQELKKVSIPSTLKTIGMEVFHSCKKLPEVTIPEGVESIGKGAFTGCEALENVTIPSTLKKISTSVFSECTNLKKISLNGENDACQMSQNLLLTKDGKTVLAVPVSGFTFVQIPEGVETIGYGAFAGCADLKMVEFPSTLKRIENYAFYECSGLINLHFPEHLNYIGERAFCQDVLTLYGENKKANISQIQIGSEVSYIGKNAFDGINASEFIVENNAIYRAKDGFLTNSSGDFIYEAPQKISDTVHIPDGTAGFSANAFSDKGEIKDIYIPESVTWIPDRAFYHTYSDDTDDDGNKKLVYSLTIHGVKGSTAEKYAKDNDITFVADM